MIDVIRTDGGLDGIRGHPRYEALFKPQPMHPAQMPPR
jgi:hypothetical protein